MAGRAPADQINENMNSKDKDKSPKKDLHDAIGLLVSQGKIRQALQKLDDALENTLPLFQGQAWLIEERRLAWLYRIDILREAGHLTEALAWACLEVEITPDNIAAVAMKERLKKEAGFIKFQYDSKTSVKHESKLPGSMWKGVAGMRDLKAMLERDVILPLQEPEIYAQYRLELPNGILLYGPPGCGKTFIARKLAKIIGYSFLEVKPGDLASVYVHGTQEKISELFASARKKAPCILFFDELDAMVPSRTANSVGHHYASEVNEFLVQLNECGRKQLLVVGATNLPGRVDSAVMRPGRLDKKFFIGPPDFEARTELLRMKMADRPQVKMDMRVLALEVVGNTCAEIEFIVNEAARSALGHKRPIAANDLLDAARKNLPAYTPEAIEKMREV